jgi:hypothetical protein
MDIDTGTPIKRCAMQRGGDALIAVLWMNRKNEKSKRTKKHEDPLKTSPVHSPE